MSLAAALRNSLTVSRVPPFVCVTTRMLLFRWSGDISGTWDSLRRQVAGSINYQLSGNALWSMDTGGYFHALDELTDVNYRELLVRW